MKNKILNTIEIAMIIFLIIFGSFLIYQITLKIFGGSWQTENLIIALLMLNIGLTFANTIRITKFSSSHNYLSNQFRHLANDFKLYLQNTK